MARTAQTPQGELPPGQDYQSGLIRRTAINQFILDDRSLFCIKQIEKSPFFRVSSPLRKQINHRRLLQVITFDILTEESKKKLNIQRKVEPFIYLPRRPNVTLLGLHRDFPFHLIPGPQILNFIGANLANRKTSPSPLNCLRNAK